MFCAACIEGSKNNHVTMQFSFHTGRETNFFWLKVIIRSNLVSIGLLLSVLLLCNYIFLKSTADSSSLNRTLVVKLIEVITQPS